MKLFDGLKQDTINREAVYSLIRQSRADLGYFFMLGISALITTIGLSFDNTAVVIGGMLIAPLLTPMLALGLGIVTFNRNSLIRSLLGIFNSVAAVLLISFLFSIFYHESSVFTGEILQRGQINAYYLVIAFLSGLGAAYSLVDPRLSAALPGVAVSVSLLPPLCVTGIAIAQIDKVLIYNSFMLFVLNFIGIVLASILIFAFFRFDRYKRIEEAEINKEQKE